MEREPFGAGRVLAVELYEDALGQYGRLLVDVVSLRSRIVHDVSAEPAARPFHEAGTARMHERIAPQVRSDAPTRQADFPKRPARSPIGWSTATPDLPDP